MATRQTADDGRTELTYNDRRRLTEGKKATLVYDSPYSGTTVEKTVTVLDTTGHVTVEKEDGTVWGVFGTSIRTTVNNKHQSGTVDAKNGRIVGYLVGLNMVESRSDTTTETADD